MRRPQVTKHRAAACGAYETVLEFNNGQTGAAYRGGTIRLWLCQKSDGRDVLRVDVEAHDPDIEVTGPRPAVEE